MFSKMIGGISKPYSLLWVLFVFVWLYALAGWIEMCRNEQASVPVSYRVLGDYMGTEIIIGVASDINECQLRATLTKAADEHQNDPARDLLFSPYLWIKVYLMDGEEQSEVPAGWLRRYVPPRRALKGPASWMDLLLGVFGKKDKFYITLEEAKSTIERERRGLGKEVRGPRTLSGAHSAGTGESTSSRGKVRFHAE